MELQVKCQMLMPMRKNLDNQTNEKTKRQTERQTQRNSIVIGTGNYKNTAAERKNPLSCSFVHGANWINLFLTFISQ